MGEDEQEVLQVGVWCRDCEWVEDSENLPKDGGTCLGCGCSPETHIVVKVVAA